MKKTCTLCKRLLATSEFNKKQRNKDGLQNVCRECNSKRARRYYSENREKHLKACAEKRRKYVGRNRELLNKIKSKGCALCGEREICCMDFHHMDENKERNISAMVGWTSSKATLFRELAKCACVCSNCHRKIHAGILVVTDEHRCKPEAVAK